MNMKRKCFEVGMIMTVVAVLAWGTSQVIAQRGGGGTGEGTSAASDASGTSGAASGTTGATGSGNASTGTTGAGQSQQSGAQPSAGTTGAASGTATQSGPNQATNNQLLESPGLQPQSQTGGRGAGLTPFDGQGANRTNQPNQINQNPANLTTGAGGQERSILNGQNGTATSSTLMQQQRDALATINFGRLTDRGLTIQTLGPGTFFYDSGLRPGDVVIGLGNQPIRTEADFQRLIVSQWGQRIPATVWRNGRQETIYVTFPQGIDGQLAQDQARRYQANRPIDPSTGRGFLGVGFDTGRFNSASVRDVLPGSAAEQAGLRKGDIIVALNGQPVNSFREAMRLIGSMQAGDTLEIEYTRRMPNRASAVLGGRPTSGPGATGEQPSEESRFYRGESQPQQQPRQELESPPIEQREGFPSPSISPHANAESIDELP